MLMQVTTQYRNRWITPIFKKHYKAIKINYLGEYKEYYDPKYLNLRITVMYYNLNSFNIFTHLPTNTVKFTFTNIGSKGSEMNQVDDWQNLIVNVASNRCQKSFKIIFNHFYPQLITQALKDKVSKELANDFAQETMLNIWRQAHSYEPTKGNLSVWIYVIARNIRYDYFRKLKKDPLKISSKDLYSEIDNHIQNENNYEDLLDISTLKKHIQNLSKDQKDILTKIYIEGMTQQEIADQENIPLGTVKSRVRLGLASIKDCVEGKLK